MASRCGWQHRLPAPAHNPAATPHIPPSPLPLRIASVTLASAAPAGERHSQRHTASAQHPQGRSQAGVWQLSRPSRLSNCVQGTLPDAWEGMSSLERLVMSGNNFVGARRLGLAGRGGVCLEPAGPAAIGGWQRSMLIATRHHHADRVALSWIVHAGPWFGCWPAGRHAARVMGQ